MPPLDLQFYGQVLIEVLKLAALETVQIAVSRGRGRLGSVLLRRPIPVNPVHQLAARMRAGRSLGPKLIGPESRWLRIWWRGRNPSDSVSLRTAGLPPKGLAGIPAKRVLVFHHADRAGPHLEGYLEYQGMAYNIGVKRLSAETMTQLALRRNSGGWLTQESQQKLIAFWKREFQVGKTAWLAQSTDHKPHEARMAWGSRETGVVGYGAGDLRQVLADDPVVMHTMGKSVEWHDPMLDPHRRAFAFKIMDEGKRSRPSNILAVGLKENPAAPTVEKLHLKFYKDPAHFQQLVGMAGIYTIKDDGASVKFRIGPKGAQFWSPRISKVTGAPIMYDSKVRDWVKVRLPETTEGMGEFLAYQQVPRLPAFQLAWLERVGLLRWVRPAIPTRAQVCRAADIGGLLNSHAPIPKDLTIQFRLYLVSRIGRQRLEHEPYAQNYERVRQLAQCHPEWEPVVQIYPWDIWDVSENFEGVVGVPKDRSLVEGGYKLKVRGDTFDWKVIEVALKPGAKDGVAGVVWFESLESGKRFKVGGGPLGSRVLRDDMMARPEAYLGRVYKVASFDGHEGRAAHVLEEHPDKGVLAA